MGRGGGFGGGGHSGGGHSGGFGGGGHHSGGFSGGGHHSGGYGGGSHGGPRGGGFHGGPGGPPPGGPHHHHHWYGGYYGEGPRRGGCGSSLLGLVIIIIWFILAFIGSCSMNSGNSSQIDESKVEHAAQSYMSGIDNDSAMLIYIAATKSDEYDYACYGNAAEDFVGDTLSDFWTYFDDNYSNDVGKQIKNTLLDYGNLFDSEGYEKIEPEEAYKSCLIKDELGYIDSETSMDKAAEEFYNKTGIQVYVFVQDYSEISSDSGSSNVLKVFLIGVVVIAAGTGIFIAVKKKSDKKRAEKLKQMEEEARILNTPLDDLAKEAGGSEMDDLFKKYDDMDKK